MAKGTATRTPRSRRSAGLGRPTDPALMFALLVEMHQMMQYFSRQLGATPEQHQRAALHARQSKSRSRPSARLIAAVEGAADVLSTWRRDKRYRGPDGSPRVLPIRGAGATLQTLVRSCAPHMSLEEVLNYICSHGEATRYKEGRVALLGSPAMLTPRTPEVTLAWLLTQCRHVADTTLHNAAIPVDQLKTRAYFQKQVAGWLSEKDFQKYAKETSPLLQELCNQLEAGLSLNRRAKPRGNRRACGVGLFLFQDLRSIG